MDLLKGTSLLKKGWGNSFTKQPTEILLADKSIVMIYFAAYWAQPCIPFTKNLKNFYEVGLGDFVLIYLDNFGHLSKVLILIYLIFQKVGEKEGIEIIYVSCDKTNKV